MGQLELSDTYRMLATSARAACKSGLASRKFSVASPGPARRARVGGVPHPAGLWREEPLGVYLCGACNC